MLLTLLKAVDSTCECAVSVCVYLNEVSEFVVDVGSFR